MTSLTQADIDYQPADVINSKAPAHSTSGMERLRRFNAEESIRHLDSMERAHSAVKGLSNDHFLDEKKMNDYVELQDVDGRKAIHTHLKYSTQPLNTLEARDRFARNDRDFSDVLNNPTEASKELNDALITNLVARTNDELEPETRRHGKIERYNEKQQGHINQYWDIDTELKERMGYTLNKETGVHEPIADRETRRKHLELSYTPNSVDDHLNFHHHPLIPNDPNGPNTSDVEFNKHYTAEKYHKDKGIGKFDKQSNLVPFSLNPLRYGEHKVISNRGTEEYNSQIGLHHTEATAGYGYGHFSFGDYSDNRTAGNIERERIKQTHNYLRNRSKNFPNEISPTQYDEHLSNLKAPNLENPYLQDPNGSKKPDTALMAYSAIRRDLITKGEGVGTAGLILGMDGNMRKRYAKPSREFDNHVLVQYEQNNPPRKFKDMNGNMRDFHTNVVLREENETNPDKDLRVPIYWNPDTEKNAMNEDVPRPPNVESYMNRRMAIEQNIHSEAPVSRPTLNIHPRPLGSTPVAPPTPAIRPTISLRHRPVVPVAPPTPAIRPTISLRHRPIVPVTPPTPATIRPTISLRSRGSNPVVTNAMAQTAINRLTGTR